MAKINGTIEGHERPAPGAGPMAIDIEQQGAVCVLRCRGSLVAGRDPDYMPGKIEALKKMKCRSVLADFREVPSIGSPGVAFLAAVYKSVVVDEGGRLVVAGATPMVQRVLEITRLSTLIEIADDLRSGFAALRASGAVESATSSRHS